MTENITELSEQNFEKNISKGNWVVDFWAEWCGPCKMMAPIFEETAKELKGKIKFGKVDVDSNSELAQKYEVMSIPTLILFKNGEIVQRTVGVHEKEEIKELTKESF